MLIVLLLLIVLLSFLYFKILLPFFYWRRRNIFSINPITRLFRVFLSGRTFPQAVCDAYAAHPSRRYYGSFQFLTPSLFVRDVELIKKITTKHFDHFTDHLAFTSVKMDPILGLNLFALKGEDWKRMRSTLSPTFTSSKMKGMFVLIKETAKDLTRHLIEEKNDLIEVQVKDLYTKYTNDVIANCAFGIKCDSLTGENEFYRMGQFFAKPTAERLIRSLLCGFFPRIFEFFSISMLPPSISNFFLHTIQATITTRQQNNIIRPDMIHLLMEARKGRLKRETSDPLPDTGFATVQESEFGTKNNQACDQIQITDELITAQALAFFIAGFTTSSALLSFLSHELALHPQIQKKLQNEIDSLPPRNDISYEEILKLRYLDQVVCEALRKYPAAYLLNRICVKDYVIAPEKPTEEVVVIEKGCLVAIPTIALHYDPEFFPQPEEFDPERFSEENRGKIVPGSYFPFGLGPRNCIGSRFALLEIKTLMVFLFAEFEVVPIEKTQIPIQFAKSLVLEAEDGVWLGLKRRRKIEC